MSSADPAPASDLLAAAAWRCAATAPDAVIHPADLAGADLRWLPTPVPGTAAGAVRGADGRAVALGCDYDSADWWFTTVLAHGCPAGSTLVLPGLATVTEVFCAGELVAATSSMFATVEVVLGEVPAGTCLAIRCLALSGVLAVRRPRGRWRSSLVSQQGLRWVRTTLLGRAEVFNGAAAPVGPWRGVALHPPGALRVLERELAPTLDGTTGVLRVRARVGGIGPGTGAAGVGHEPGVGDEPGVAAELVVGGVAGRVRLIRDGADLLLDTTIRLPAVACWWPHSHGPQALHEVVLRLGADPVALGVVGFRTVTVDRTAGRFTLTCNGIEVFCRGAVWAPLDPVGFAPDPVGTRAVLSRLAEAGLNMVRVPGTGVYEDDDFYRACAELGLLVWQDAMLATLDPAGEEAGEWLRVEVEQLCRRLQGNPAVVVFSGGSETEQQPTLLGLPAAARTVPAIEVELPAIVDTLLPGVVVVASSPTGGPLPTHVGTGVAHWFGVGAYLRPTRDVRSAGVRFAAECLAFATPPERAAVEAHFGTAAVAGHHPAWKAAVPRDRGSSWDFEDVRDHYVRTLFGVDPFTVRRTDPEHYLDLGRAAVCVAVEEVMTWWRRPRSGCAGGLVLSAVDLEPGPGWGVLDVDRAPKAPWHVLRRVLAPVAVLLSDDGLDGIGLDVVNDTGATVSAALTVHAHTAHGGVLSLVEQAVQVGAHSALSCGLDELTGRFLDLNHAYAFGPPAYDAVSAQLRDGDGVVLAESACLTGGPDRPRLPDVGLAAHLTGEPADGWTVALTTRASAQWVCVEVAGYEPSDSWFHLPAGATRTLTLRPGGSAGASGVPGVPTGRVRAVNSARQTTIGGPR
jgi:beta-mannosidase